MRKVTLFWVLGGTPPANVSWLPAEYSLAAEFL